MNAVNFTQGQTAFNAAAAVGSGGTGAGAPGRLMGVLITTQGSTTGTALSIYDSATTASSTPVILSLYGSGTAAYTIPVFLNFGPQGIPFSSGLWTVSTASTGAVGTLLISTACPNDGRPGT